MVNDADVSVVFKQLITTQYKFLPDDQIKPKY